MSHDPYTRGQSRAVAKDDYSSSCNNDDDDDDDNDDQNKRYCF